MMGGLGKGPGQFKEPSGVTVDEYGNLLVADSKNNRVQVCAKNKSCRRVI